MKTVFSFFVFNFLSSIKAEAQTIRINEAVGNRPLTWPDFIGQPDTSSPFDAVTFWNIHHQFSFKNSGDSIKASFSVILELGAKS